MKNERQGTSPRTTDTTIWKSATLALVTLVPRDVAARNAKDVCDQGLGVGPTGYGVYLDFAAAIEEKGIDAVKSKVRQLV